MAPAILSSWAPSGVRRAATTPLRPSRPPSAPPPVLPHDNGRDVDLNGARVLLVEDETFLALDIQYELCDAHAEVIGPVARLEEGLEVVGALEADNRLPHAAILDVNLCGVDVFPLADELARHGVPFLFHTAHGERSELDTRFHDAPICAKPMDADLLVAQVARMIARLN